MVAVASLRAMILAILIFGMAGTAVELLFLHHYEDIWQLVPLSLIGAGVIVVGWHAVSRTSSSLRVMRVIMVAFIAAGALGIWLHYQGSAEFQKEVDPSIHGFALFMKVMQSKAPPALAPGLMAQLGLLGLAFTYRGGIS
jgi:hypothetical protein